MAKQLPLPIPPRVDFFRTMGPFDKTRCSFHVPEFASAKEERQWCTSLTGSQRLELLYLSNLARYGEEAMNRPLDKSTFRVLTMEEANAEDEQDERKDEAWRKAHGWPPRFGRWLYD